MPIIKDSLINNTPEDWDTTPAIIGKTNIPVTDCADLELFKYCEKIVINSIAKSDTRGIIIITNSHKTFGNITPIILWHFTSTINQ